MLNYLWAGMVLVGILWGAFHGNLNLVTDGALNSAKEAVSLCITMLGVMSFWTGILKIGEMAGLIERMSGAMEPILQFLYPKIPRGHPAREYISTNMIANLLGLGWAATPAGLKAMESLEELEEERREKEIAKNKTLGTGKGKKKNSLQMSAVPTGTASNEMCTFLIINISSLQLIPINMITYRSQYGSVNPTAIVGPALVATMISTVVGILFCKLMDREQS